VDKLKPSGKPFEISKWEVWEAHRQVKANRGAPGVDGVTLEVFEKDLQGNLYKIWNRMSSGSYFPPPATGAWWATPKISVRMSRTDTSRSILGTIR
jgi:retron-type reverse transcriptase